MPPISHILLVDDDEVNNFLNLRLLKRLAIADQVKVASSGQVGLTLLNNHLATQPTSPLLIFLDINMPMMNGFEFLDQVRKLDMQAARKPIIIMLTTSTNEKDLAQVRQYPEVANFINKPLSEEKVEAVVKAYFSAG